MIMAHSLTKEAVLSVRCC